MDMILNSLPTSFNQFKLNYNMKKLGYSLSELVSSLQAMEGIVTGGHGVLNLEKASSSRHRPKGRGRRNKKDFKV